MTLLIALLALNAVLYGVLVARFGAKENVPFLINIFVYAALATAAILAVPKPPEAVKKTNKIKVNKKKLIA